MVIQFATFTSSGTWQAPIGTSGAILIGSGGGGGGGCADDDFVAGGGGGGGSIQQAAFVLVSALTTYTVTIGAGGSGGVPSVVQTTFCGQDGYSTTLSNGGTVLFTAPGGGGAGTNLSGAFNHGGLPWANPLGNIILENGHASPVIPGSGGGWQQAGDVGNGVQNFMGNFVGGTSNSDEFSYGAGGGGAGPNGNGGNAGSLASPNGVNASNNTGAGGGGGNTNSTTGGNGGSGYLYIIW